MRFKTDTVDSGAQISHVKMLIYNFVYYIVKLLNLSHMYYIRL